MGIRSIKTMTEKSKGKELAKAATMPEMNPFAKRDSPTLNRGTVAIEESRAVTEAMGKLYIAKKFPRDEGAAYEKVIESCKRPNMAESAEYAYARGTETISGPSIRLAEEMARAWGNIDFGIRELSDDEESTEMEAYAWDLETNVISSQKFRVKKERKTRQGSYKLVDQRDIYEQNANLGNRRLRARILALLPPDLKEAALAQCKLTLQPAKEELPERVEKMLKEFKKFKVTIEMVEKKIGKAAKDFTSENFTNLIAIHNSLKDGFSKPADWFEGIPQDEKASTEGAAGDLNEQLKNQQ